MRTSVTFTIARTWDGEPARQDEIATVVATRTSAGLTLTLDAPFHGDPAPAEPAGPRDGLWDFEVVEFFLVGPPSRPMLSGATDSDPTGTRPPLTQDLPQDEVAPQRPTAQDPAQEYLEIEVGPHGHHLALRLRGRRQAWARALPMACEVQRSGARWRATVQLPDLWLPPPPWTANAFALHGAPPGRRYLCAHPTGGPRPDFHRLETFAPFDPPATEGA